MAWTWRDEIVEVLRELGGAAALPDIYARIEKRGRKNLVEASVRQTIEDHSSDSQSWRAKPIDLFRSDEGMGRGVWALREMLTAPTPDAPDTDAPAKVLTEVYRTLRHTQMARKIKLLYGNRCQVCGHAIPVADGSYSEAHHIHPLGEDGPDVAENILVLCPNHHVMFDFGTIAIDPTSLIVVSVGGSDPNDGARITSHASHTVGRQFLSYHLKRRYQG